MARSAAHQRWGNFVYDAFLWIFSIIVELFFREIHPRSTWKVPRNGPLIIVAAPHANQFVDPLILMRVLRQDVHRRVCWLIAAKSMKRQFIGFGAGLVGSVPVGRALDLKKPAPGKIYLPDPENDPTLIKGVDTNFQSEQFMVGGLLVLPTVNNEAANVEIAEIVGPEEIRIKKPFKGPVAYKQLTGKEAQDSSGTESFEGTKFSVAPHVDQSAVYDKVFEKLKEDGCIGIFPEGGSHDRTELLPLKAGVAIMALGALAENPDCGVKIVPCGMNYFHAHKFRSRAVVEFGTPVEISPELVQKYKSGEKREAVGQVLELVYNALYSVTVQTPDYDTLMLIQAVRRLYNPKGKKLPLPMIVELNRRLVRGYQTYKDDPRIVNLKKSILDYNKTLMMLNIRDHQVSYAKFPLWKVVFALVYRIGKLALLSIAVLPGTVLFAPVFIAGKVISIRKSKEALAASSVKVKARDVVATWKLLVSMALAPALYTFYNVILAIWTHRNRIGGRVPEWVPLWTVFLVGYIIFPTITFGSLRFGEVGMDIVKSLRPLFLALQPQSGNTMHKLRERRNQLVEQVTDVINELGPELYPDFDHYRIINDPNHPLSPLNSRPTTPRERSRSGRDMQLKMTPDSTSPITPTFERRSTAQTNEHLPRNESFKDLGKFSIFATHPGTPSSNRSRASSHTKLSSLASNDLKPMTTANSKAGMDEISQKINSAMRERGRRRASEDVDGSWILSGRDDDDGATSDFEPDEAKKDI
ncbi:hypothetical protein K461DRAFT_292539 [Myriangium duriaei CBS 260.36]|uniref:Phospholipid/glycerol acyltransferase domain-containing protein n=1 Tax=Myriangium duriaei CBS 260.36 TaxID=1168546 RepID=A0A9P4J4A1_9PEZI|nr:hypothetical protein K461DRAFT_292539 [Myriangium duriaei CBS 260.36]